MHFHVQGTGEPMRRSHLHQGALALGGTALLLAAPHVGAAPLVEHVMDVVGWSDGVAFANPRGIAIDPLRGDIAVANTSGHRIEVFSAGGRPRLRFVHGVETREGQRKDGFPSGIVMDRAGRMLVVDNLAPYVDVLNGRGRSVDRIVLPDSARPVAIAAARDGSVLVAEAGAGGRVHRYDADLAFVRSWGVPGNAAGHLEDIQALAELPDGRVVVVCPRTEFVVQVFTGDGTFVNGFGHIDMGPENFSLPSGVAVTDDGRIWISDEIRQRIQVYQPDGLFLGAVSGGDAGAGDFLYPSAIATDGQRHIAVVERAAGRYRLLRLPTSQEEAHP